MSVNSLAYLLYFVWDSQSVLTKLRIWQEVLTGARLSIDR